MGLINNDVYSCANGVQKAGTYISFGTETVYLCQASSDPSIPAADRKYNVRANYRVYWDKDCRNANKPFLDLQSVSTQLSAAQLETNLYGALYEALKVIYPNCSDELVRAAAPAETPVVPAETPVVPADAPAPAAPAESSAPSAAADASAPAESTPSESSEPDASASAPAASTPSEPAADASPSVPAAADASAPAESTPAESSESSAPSQ